MIELILCNLSTSHTNLQVELKSDGSIAAVWCADCRKMLSTETVKGIEPRHCVENMESKVEKYIKSRKGDRGDKDD